MKKKNSHRRLRMNRRSKHQDETCGVGGGWGCRGREKVGRLEGSKQVRSTEVRVRSWIGQPGGGMGLWGKGDTILVSRKIITRNRRIEENENPIFKIEVISDLNELSHRTRRGENPVTKFHSSSCTNPDTEEEGKKLSVNHDITIPLLASNNSNKQTK